MIFLPFRYFSQIFEQVKEWSILELHEMIRVPHIAVCLVVFSLLCGLGKPAEVLRLIKNVHFILLLAVWLLFISSLGRLGSGLLY